MLLVARRIIRELAFPSCIYSQYDRLRNLGIVRFANGAKVGSIEKIGTVNRSNLLARWQMSWRFSYQQKGVHLGPEDAHVPTVFPALLPRQMSGDHCFTGNAAALRASRTRSGVNG
jgi:hypothetical protein